MSWPPRRRWSEQADGTTGVYFDTDTSAPAKGDPGIPPGTIRHDDGVVVHNTLPREILPPLFPTKVTTIAINRKARDRLWRAYGVEPPPPKRRRWLRTWHLEMTAVAGVLATVAAARGSWTEWLAAAAVLATFGHASVAERLREQEAAREAAAVECHRWLGRYYVAKELLWIAFFVATGAFAALVGCGVFLAYPIWRRWWRGHG